MMHKAIFGTPAGTLAGTLALLLLVPIAGWADEAAPTNGAMARQLLGELLAPALALCPSHLPLRIESDLDSLLLEDVYGIVREGPWNLHHGLAGVEEVTTVLILGELDAEVSFPREREPLLSFGGAQLLRRNSVGLRGRLVAWPSGEELWDSAPRIIREDWIPESALARVSEESPEWLLFSAPPATAQPGRSGWWERALVAGLVGGAAIVYLSGSAAAN